MPKEILSGWVDSEIAELVRDVAYWDRETVSSVITEACEKLIEARVKTRGIPYPRRPEDVKKGRPPKARPKS